MDAASDALDTDHSGSRGEQWTSLRHRLIPLMRASARASIACIAREYLSLLAAIAAGAVLLSQPDLQAWAKAALAIPLLAIVAALQHRLSGLGHEASHYVLFRNPLWNELASDLLLMFPIFAITQRYRASHFGHHRFVNDVERDPDWKRLAAFERMDFPMRHRRFLARFVLRGLWPPATLKYLFGRALAANVSQAPTGRVEPRAPYGPKVARRLRGSYWLSILTLVHATNGWLVFFLFWVAPLLTFYPFFMLLREIAHHANAPDDGPLTNSRHFEVHPILAWAIFPYGQDFHLLHHLYAMIPHHQMPAALAVLRESPSFRDSVITCQGYFFRKAKALGPSVLQLIAQPGAWRPGPSTDRAASSVS